MKVFFSVAVSKIESNWEEILLEKTAEQNNECIAGFNALQSRLLSLNKSIADNQSVKKNLSEYNSKKLFEELLASNPEDNFSIEIYDRKFDMVFFEGRQLNPEYTLLQRAFTGTSFSVIKENGFYTYLLIFTPVFSDIREVLGIVVTGELIDIKYPENLNAGFSNKTFADLLSNKLDVSVEIIPADLFTGEVPYTEDSLSHSVKVKLYGIDGKNIGLASYQEYQIATHIKKIEQTSSLVVSVLFALLFIVIIPVLFRLINFIRSSVAKVIFVFILLLIFRYILVLTEFPSAFIESDIFIRQYFASKFGFGIAKSLGDLFVTSLFFLFFSVYVSYIVFSEKIRNAYYKIKNRPLIILIYSVLLIFLFFGILDLFGLVFNSIIIDSKVKLLDKSSILPDLPLFVVQFSVLLISLSFIYLGVTIVILLFHYARSISQNIYFRKLYVLVLYIIFIFLSQLAESEIFNYSLSYFHRLILISLVFLVCFYIYKKSANSKTYFFFSLKNVSLILLIAVILSPSLLLDKTKSDENSYLEKIGSELSESQQDKIFYLITNELLEYGEDPNLVKYIRDPMKSVRLSYYLWQKGTLKDRNYKVNIIVLDTAKNLISDFNPSNGLISSDDVIKFTKKNYFSKSFFTSPPDNDSLELQIPETTDNEEGINEPFTFDNVNIIYNQEKNYFTGIIPLEKLELRNTQFAGIVGYILLSVNSDAISMYTDLSFRGVDLQTAESPFNKFITRPIITEYSDGNIANTTDAEVSRGLLPYLETFNEFVKSTGKKSYWRFDIIKNEKYRTYFTEGVSEKKFNSGENGLNKRVFSISLKRDDFALLALFFLKFIIFSALIYSAVLLIYGIIFLIKIKRFRFYFREKIFISFFVVSVIPIILLALYTRSYISQKYDDTIKNRMISDLSMLNETLKEEKQIFNRFKPTDSIAAYVNDILKRNYSSSGKNFNFYFKNRMIATTDDELFKSDFLDTRISSEGYYNINLLKKDLFLKSQNINGMSFLVGFRPLKEKDNTIYGILSSLSVYSQKEINEELSETLTFIFGSYLIVIIALLLIVSFLAGKISYPVLLLKEASEKIAKGESGVKIDIDRNDEFGDLVNAFNNMSADLDRSKEELKKAERESAWRDIARRVAHEIKNPLTPMKLSIQHLWNLYKSDKKNDFEATLKQTRDMISDEIDKLSKIASSFSDFAKLPSRNYEQIDINSVLSEVLSLYSAIPNIKYEMHLEKDIKKIYADRMELNRVFQNIIKNSVQAIENEGVISVKTYNTRNKVVAEISDNGTGIDDETMRMLFVPNFSTKKTGMGLGLSIAKKSLDDLKAEITIESVQGGGTTVKIFFVPYVS